MNMYAISVRGVLIAGTMISITDRWNFRTEASIRP